MSNAILDYRKMLFLKAQLLTTDLDELIDFYSDYDCYLDLVETVSLLQDREIGFFMLDSRVIDNVLRLINIYRFTDKGKAVFDVIDRQVGNFNELKSECKYFGDIMDHPYVTMMQMRRGKKYIDSRILISDIVNDFNVFEELRTNRFYGCSDQSFLESVNYFLSDFPQLFTDDTFYNNLSDRINRIKFLSKMRLNGRIRETKDKVFIIRKEE